MNHVLLLAGLLTATAMLAACGPATPPNAGNTEPAFVVNDGHVDVGPHSPLRRELRVAPVTVSSTASRVTVPTTVEIDPSRSIAIVAPGTGRIVEVRVALGQKVTKGQILLSMVSGDVAQARADDARARDAHALAAQALARAQQVHDAGGASTRDLEAARSAFAQTRAEQVRADTQLAVLGSDPATAASQRTLAIKAPMAGVITSLGVAPGALVNDSSAVLMTVTNLERVWVTASVPEAESAWVSRGALASLTFASLPGVTLQGTVDTIDPVLDSDTRRVRAHLVVDNHEGRLLPNMFGLADVALPAARRLLVPQSAVIMDNDRLGVFVERAPWRYERRDVEAGRDEGQDVEITRGLAAGDRVVTRGGVLLQ